MRNLRLIRRLAGGPLLMAGLMLSGCGGLNPWASRAPQPGTPRYFREQAARQGRSGQIPGRVPDARPPSALKQHENGPGVVICEPVATGAPRPIRDFGAGCSRWIHFQVAGHVEFGKTPLWDNFNDALVWKDEKGLVMTLDQAASLSRTIGATHAAVGQIGGDEKRCRLQYQIYEIPARKPVGPALTAVGTREQVVAQLPQLARELTTALGVSKPRVADRVVETVSDLELVGSLPRPIYTPLSSQQGARLKRLAQTSPLGAMFFVIDGLNTGGAHVKERAEQLIALAEDHPVAWGTVGLCFLNSGVRESGGLLPKLEVAAQRSPQNYQLSTALAMIVQAAANWGRARHLSEEAARCATSHPMAWLMLAQSLSSEAQSIRQGRTAGAINSSEWEQLRKLYPYWQDAAQKMVDLDPTIGDWWVELAVAATFTSDERTADEALWAGIERGTMGTRAYWWGLEIYQPKWYPNPAKLRRVAEAAASRTFKNSADRITMAQHLYHHQFRNAKGPLYTQVLRTPAERLQIDAWVKGHQASIQRHVHIGKPVITRKRTRPDALRAAQKPPTHPQIKAIGSHAGGIVVMATSPDGQWIAAGGGDGRVSLVSPAGELRGTFAAHHRYVRALAWSPDGSKLASAGSDGTVRIWERESRSNLKILRGHKGRVCGLAWLSGNRILSGGEDGTLRQWDAQSGAQQRVATGLGGEVMLIACSPDESLVAVSTGPPAYQIEIRDGATLKRRQQLSKPSGVTHALAWSPDGSQLASGGRGAIHLWASGSGELARSLDLEHKSVMALDWSTNGKQLFYIGTDRTFHLLDITGGEDLLVAADISREALHQSWDDGSQRLVSGGSDGNVLLWDLKEMLKPPVKALYTSRPQ